VGGQKVVRVVGRDVSASFGNGTTSFVTLTDGFGFFVIQRGTAGGLAGEIGGNVTISVPGVTVSGDFSLAINTSATLVDDTIAFRPAAGTTTSLALGDVNGDFKPDLVVGTSTGKNLLYLNDGDGNPFDTIPGIEIGNETDDTTGVALVDLNRDGSLDLVVSNN